MSLLRDSSYLKHLRGQPCVITGLSANTACDVVAAHIRYGSTGGMGLKPPDSHALPLGALLHQHQHSVGETAFWRSHVTDDLLMRALLALARERYAAWKS